MSSLYLDAPFADIWRGLDPFAEVERLQGVEYRALEGRRTFRTEVAGCGYFVKIHRGIGWREIGKNLLSLRLPVLGARNEFEAIGRLAAVGVPSMRAVAFGVRGANPARQHSFLITEELTPTQALDDAWNAPGKSLSRRQKLRLIATVADMVRRMHAAGVNHRDLYLCHFLLHTDSPADAPRLSLIDLHRSQIRARVPRRWRDKDLAALYFSALERGIGRNDTLRFLKTYFGLPLREVLVREARLLSFLELEGKRLLRRYLRKYAPPAQLQRTP